MGITKRFSPIGTNEFQQDIQELLSHVTKEHPNISNVIKMHNMIHRICLHDTISHQTLYHKIQHSPFVNERYKRECHENQ